MEFRLNDKGEPTKAALAMFDPKGEKVCLTLLSCVTEHGGVFLDATLLSGV